MSRPAELAADLGSVPGSGHRARLTAKVDGAKQVLVWLPAAGANGPGDRGPLALVQAELPGVDPAKDMEVTVAKGILTIRAERHEEMQSQHRSEFRYGTFTRHIALPVTADAADIKATYHWGLLQVSIGLHDTGEDKAGRRIPVQATAS